MFSITPARQLASGLAALVIFCGPALAQETAQPTTLQPPPGAITLQAFNDCKREAYDYGVMGTFRRLFILSCLDTDMTASNRASLD